MPSFGVGGEPVMGAFLRSTRVSIGPSLWLGALMTMTACVASGGELPSGSGSTPAGSSTGDDGPQLTVGSLVTGLDTAGNEGSGPDSGVTQGGASTGDPSSGDTDASGGDGSSGGGTDLPDYCDETVPVAGDDSLIDDLEPEEGQVFPDEEIPAIDGRVGFWFTFNDGTPRATQVPAPGSFQPTDEGADGSEYSAHTVGDGFTAWGAGLAVSLNNDFAGNCPYDGSTYDGISFWARGSGSIRLVLVTRDTAPTELGGRCEEATAACDDHHGISISLDPEWTRHEIAWDQLSQQGWGEPAEFDATELLELQWQSPEEQPFDFYIDELRFWNAAE